MFFAGFAVGVITSIIVGWIIIIVAFKNTFR